MSHILDLQMTRLDLQSIGLCVRTPVHRQADPRVTRMTSVRRLMCPCTVVVERHTVYWACPRRSLLRRSGRDCRDVRRARLTDTATSATLASARLRSPIESPTRSALACPPPRCGASPRDASASASLPAAGAKDTAAASQKKSRAYAWRAQKERERGRVAFTSAAHLFVVELELPLVRKHDASAEFRARRGRRVRSEARRADARGEPPRAIDDLPLWRRRAITVECNRRELSCRQRRVESGPRRRRCSRRIGHERAVEVVIERGGPRVHAGNSAS